MIFNSGNSCSSFDWYLPGSPTVSRYTWRWWQGRREGGRGEREWEVEEAGVRERRLKWERGESEEGEKGEGERGQGKDQEWIALG